MATQASEFHANAPIEQVPEKTVMANTYAEEETDEKSISARSGTIWTIVGCALANFSDGYQQNLASSTNVIFNHLLTTKKYTSAWQTRISNALLVGSVIGIVILGYTSDRYSRKGGMFFTSALVVIGSLLAMLVFQAQPLGIHNMLWFMTIARGIAGVGVGGEYPTSAAAALEGSNEYFDSQRGPIQVLISTLMATSGGPVCTFVYLAALLGSNDNLKVAFHAMYGVSIFLPFLVILFRLKMRDGLLFKKSNFKKRHVPWMLVLRKYGLRLLGTSSAFFFYDFINFPNSIMSSAIINSIVPGKAVRTVAVWQLILALLPIPGVLLGAWLVNKIGRKWTGVLGFGGYIVLGFIIGGCYDPLTKNSIAAFVVLYGLLQALGHMGPGATIGLMSVESYPTAVRGMGYGISAGFGKAGAAIGTQVFTPIQAAAGKASTFYVAGGVGVIGAIIYCFLPEGRAVDLAIMDADFERYMKEAGYTEEFVEEKENA
ncbi:putative glycerophosphoinositol transporter GIT1 [Coleophoma crateriformis]|uniref:Putative glycerophosphoinositol transporter GIT1 n=1 Tax=Coleophoma crateriformis TaxID=565419 RepID=A0A3D8T7P3_9HELO|nr:putative glycerophosphoinositol transporter GIT1 [Coleophoma crateriformis]